VKNESQNTATELAALESFANLPKALADVLEKQGITTPTEVQARAIPAALAGRSVLAQSHTGSGKTLAFGIPLALLLKERKHRGNVGALVLTPTRELATQVSKVFETTLSALHLRTLPITGGASYGKQKGALKSGVDIVVGTPGRIVDLIAQEILILDDVEILVLDEVDQMLDQGFAEDLNKIRDKVGQSKQTLFFSATLNRDIRALARGILKDPIEITTSTKGAQSPATIKHSYLEVRTGAEQRALVNALMYHNPEQALIFCKTKQECADLTDSLLKRGFHAEALHGDLSQQDRNAALDRFRSRRLQYLIATNVAARGIDLQELPLVVNFNVPYDVESYTHRVGRTGRNGKFGMAWTIVTPQSRRNYEFIMRHMSLRPDLVAVPNASEILHKAAENHIANLQAPRTGAANRTAEKAATRALEKLTAEEKETLLKESLVRQLERMETYYSDEIVVGRPLVDLDAAPEKRKYSDNRGGQGHSGYRNSRGGGHGGGGSRPFSRGGSSAGGGGANAADDKRKPFKAPFKPFTKKPRQD
jgi:ATP-dependent RNA helicase DeaD